MIYSQHHEPAVAVRHVSKSFTGNGSGTSVILDDLSFSIAQGEVIGLFGPSGCGKSTLLRILCGVLPFDAGDVRILGKRDLERRGLVAYVPQRSGLLPWKTLKENAMLGWMVMGRRVSSDRPAAQADALFERFGLSSVASRYPQQSSGGERQRTALVRALLTPAPILALDEPVTAIDHITRVGIYEELLTIVQEGAAFGSSPTVVMISHDPEELILLCDRILVMSQRPSTIVATVRIPFARPRDAEIKFSPAFAELKRALWRLLR